MRVVQGGIDAHIGMLGLGVARPGKMAMIMGTSFVQLAFANADEKLKLDGIWGPYNEPVVPTRGFWKAARFLPAPLSNGSCANLT